MLVGCRGGGRGGVLGNYLIYKCVLQNAQSCLFISVWECECPSCVGAFRRYDTIECNANELKVNKNKSRKNNKIWSRQSVHSEYTEWTEHHTQTHSPSMAIEQSQSSSVQMRSAEQLLLKFNSKQIQQFSKQQ